jgi:hypothetical protein
MANSKLIFFNKRGEPVNLQYVGPTGPTPADAKFIYNSETSSSSEGYVDIMGLGSGTIVFNTKDSSGFDITNWAKEIELFLLNGSKINIKISVLGTSQIINFEVASLSIGSDISLNFINTIGSTILSTGRSLYFETTYSKRPGGFYKGNVYFDEVSAGLFENYELFILQEFKNNAGDVLYGYPHSDINLFNPEVQSKWRTRWDSNNYGNVDITDIIFNYKIIEEDNPIIYNYPNVVYETFPGGTSDYISEGYIVTEENLESAMSINIALNASEIGADVYQRKLIVEELSETGAYKVLELDFYGQIIGEDERLDILTRNLGRAFMNTDSYILRDHDPSEPLPDYIEINEKRKELMVAGEEIFPYIGSYKGLINAIKFFGYQDLRIKEYWMNIKHSEKSLTPLQSTTTFLDKLNKKGSQQGYTQNVLINDILDNQNEGKYKLVQTYGPNADGKYVLDVSSENTLLPSNVYKKTSFFGLYYDILKVTDRVDPYGYPIVEDAFLFTQDEIILKLFALRERLKKSYLPLNARIVDITGEGVYYNVYNTKAWTDSVDRFDIDSGFNISIKTNPDFGFIEDLRTFSTRKNETSIQVPKNYNNSGLLDFGVSGASGDSFVVSGYYGYNPKISINKGNKYTITNSSSVYGLSISTSSVSVVDPIGILNNGATAGTPIIFDVNPEEIDLLYYTSTGYSNLMGEIEVLKSGISDLGNISDPLSNRQKYSPEQTISLLSSISNFYEKKQNGEIIELGDNRYDPTNYIDPNTGEAYKSPIGMPVILELDLDRWAWDDMGVNWSSVSLPILSIGDYVTVKSDDILGSSSYIGEIGGITDINYSTGVYEINIPSGAKYFEESSLFISKQNNAMFTWKNLDFTNYVEIEWVINKPASQEGTPYNFNFRGPVTDYYKLPHFLPYTGKYDVTCNVYDSDNFKNVKVSNEMIEVSPRTIDIDAWTRYRENEFYIWNQTERDWNDYDSMWEFPAEGKTYNEMLKEFPKELLEFVNYGNSAYEGQNILVNTGGSTKQSYGSFIFEQNSREAQSIVSTMIPGTYQYGFALVTTAEAHNLSEGDIIYIKGATDDINGDWEISIPEGGTGNTFIIPTVLFPQSGIKYTNIPPVKTLSLDPYFYPDPRIEGGGTISVTIGGRLISETEIKDSIYSTTRDLIYSVNKTFTSPDYIASTEDHNANPVSIKISSNIENPESLNGDEFLVNVSGSGILISTSTELSGGLNKASEYQLWEETDDILPNENLRLWGTKRMRWDSFYSSKWEDTYAHGWEDFEFSNDWLGGYKIYGIKSGDHIKVNPGALKTPFPIGVTFSGPPFEGDPLDLISVANQMNLSDDENILRFNYSVYPSSLYNNYSSLSGPTGEQFECIEVPVSSFQAPPSVPGANPINLPDFTYATGP